MALLPSAVEAQIMENSKSLVMFGLSLLVIEDSSSQDYSIRIGYSVLNSYEVQPLGIGHYCLVRTGKLVQISQEYSVRIGQ